VEIEPTIQGRIEEAKVIKADGGSRMERAAEQRREYRVKKKRQRRKMRWECLP